MMSDCLFDSWLVLCEAALEIGELEAQKRMLDEMFKLAEKIADEIIETADEYNEE